MRSLSLVTLLMASSTGWTIAAEAAKDSPLGKPAPNFALRDFRGKSVEFQAGSIGKAADTKATGTKATVVLFLGVECPLARQYASRLSQLAEEFGTAGVDFLAIDSNQQDSVTEMASFATRYGLTVPFLKDPGNVVADQFRAERTPQVFVVDAGGIVRYQGRIDDQFGFQTGIGYAKPNEARRDLAEAITEVVAGREVSEPLTPVKGCLIGRVREVDPNARVTYSNQVARVMQKHCVECHRPGQIAPFSLTNYEEAVGWSEMIEEVVREQRMPPWSADPAVGHWRNDRRLNESEKQDIVDWVAAGAPEGDRAELPLAAQFSDGWMIPDPDEVIWMGDKAAPVQAEGTIEYQYFVVDPGFKEDKWVKMAECRPGERSVVHHIIVFIQKPGVEIDPKKNRGESQDLELLHGTAPGMPPLSLPEGMAVHVPSGSKLVFQMHYTANGVPTEDRSSIALVYADPSEVRQAVRTDNATNFSFQIPAQADSHPVTSEYKFQKDAILVWLMPHMHIRGKDFRYELRYPDGTQEALLNVPRYDFNWQLVYDFAQPKHVPAGTVMHCMAHFDNSESNLANPDPTKPVRWGDQTWEEMMIGWFGVTTDVGPEAERAEAFRQRLANGTIELSSRVTRAAKRALKTEQAFENLSRALPSIVPQVDRICVSVTDGDQVRFIRLAQSPALRQPLGDTAVTFAAQSAELARLAALDQTSVLSNLADQTADDMQRMSTRLGSSVHVPIHVGGKAASVNFWSTEPDAFPAEAVKLLEEVARLMDEGQ